MKIIQLKLDFLHGPIWKDCFDIDTGKWYTGVDVIDNNTNVAELEGQIQNLYNSFYYVNKEGSYSFDEASLIASKETLLALMNELVSLLAELNDGGYEIDDYITPALKKL